MIYVSLTRGDNEKICWLFMTSMAANGPLPLLCPFPSLFHDFSFAQEREPSVATVFLALTRIHGAFINFSLAFHPTKLTGTPL